MALQIRAATAAGGDHPNEDYFLASNSWAVVLDGVTRYPDDGCVHDVPWYVARLGAALASALATGPALREALARGIEVVADAHRATCDLENPVSPAATVAIARFAEDRFEWLVLGDCAIAWRRPGRPVEARSDDRLARLADPPRPIVVGGLRRYSIEYVARVRNRPGGFWVASTDPDAADQALTGTEPFAGLEAAALLSDGLTRLVERYGRTWTQLLDLGLSQGPASLIATVRAAERSDRRFGDLAKRHDDATAVLLGPR
ncbi:protein phosphatase 2C domain-containing protein [Glycomyces sp. L485]|uniref:protein phosphatase 2C domain-containing protein n=1 Tax=Glycomyces sp. L485 TaxID=2909235 RepID=UPI001F4AED78|nr:protein phosphatase 2C domain-containing protein [Glycomyces sp. L485]MCH7230562.1 protein phosphatase 2C domain-containing protein [Glycomyces sp. L485]